MVDTPVKCELCLRECDRLAKSHIIPRALIMHGRTEGSREPMLLFPSDPSKSVQRSQAGIYSRIVCADCEASFQAGDDALIELLRTFDQGVAIKEGVSRDAARAYPNIDAATLHRGILTTLFRMHLSPHPLFNRVDLGPSHGEAIRAILQSGNSALNSIYRVVLRIVPGAQGAPIRAPFRERWEGVNAYRIYFPHITAFVKVDHRSFGGEFERASLGNFHCPVAIIAGRLAPAELSVLAHTLVGRDAEVQRYADEKNV